ncbi:MAG: sigma factor-like helix-turn-helix DNA-binding protein, partial [Pannonibacter sp.]
RQRELVRALLDLPIHYREAILLVGVLGESYKDAADILDCDIGTIKSRVSRARAALSEVINAPITE